MRIHLSTFILLIVSCTLSLISSLDRLRLLDSNNSFFLFLDMCYIDRFTGAGALLSTGSYNFIYIIMLLLHLLLILLVFRVYIASAVNYIKHIYSIIAINYYIFYYILYYTVNILKNMIADSNCNNKHRYNSISGHYAFIVYFALSLYLLYLYGNSCIDEERTRKRSITYTSTKLSAINISIYIISTITIVLSIFTLYQTYIYGYHSSRQIIYGINIAILFYIIVRYIIVYIIINTIISNNKDKTIKRNLILETFNDMAYDRKHLNYFNSNILVFIIYISITMLSIISDLYYYNRKISNMIYLDTGMNIIVWILQYKILNKLK